MTIPGDARQQDHNLCDQFDGICLGIDPSLNSTGLALLTDECLTTWTWQTKLMGIERLYELDQLINELLVDARPKIVFLEDYAFSKGNQAHQAGEWGGCIRLALHRHNVQRRLPAPTQVKKFACSGAAQKSEIMLNLFKRWGLDVPQEDEADATVMALMALYSSMRPEAMRWPSPNHSKRCW